MPPEIPTGLTDLIAPGAMLGVFFLALWRGWITVGSDTARQRADAKARDDLQELRIKEAREREVEAVQITRSLVDTLAKLTDQVEDMANGQTNTLDILRTWREEVQAANRRLP